MPDLLASDGTNLVVDVIGPDDAATVVLVHGLAASVERGFGATGVLRRLRDADVRIVAYDARGHGRSDRPHDPARYGDARAAADLAEVVAAFAGSDAIVAGYSMGSATVLWTLAAGLVVRGAVLGAPSSAVLEWTADSDATAATAIAVLEGRQEPGAALQWWVEFLDSTGADRLALAALLRGHRPVVEDWDAITVPIVVANGVDDLGAAPAAALQARLPHATAVELPGDHVRAAASVEYTDAIIGLVRR
jgi:pimeloyl-ACP methyl ester carboxylesterase